MMAKTYTELEAWGIFIGALVIGIVSTSIFWAYITVPESVKQIQKEISNVTTINASATMDLSIPKEFVTFCSKVDGTPIWDNTGFRQCTVEDSSGKNLLVMNFLCRKFNLTLSYGSFGVKCEGKI